MTVRVVDRQMVDEFLESVDAEGVPADSWIAAPRDAVETVTKKRLGIAIEDGSCLRGMFVALGIEAATTMILLGGWYLSQVLK
jgi:hypothetical protein